MTHKQAFNKAYEMLKEGVQCKLYRLDGLWTVEKTNG